MTSQKPCVYYTHQVVSLTYDIIIYFYVCIEVQANFSFIPSNKVYDIDTVYAK